MGLKTYVLYHGSCPDGFCAAFAFWKKYGDAAVYLPVYHGEAPPEMEEGADLFIVDFSYKKDILLKLKAKHPNLVLIDHHISAQEDLQGLDFPIFDMTKSGAVLAHEYLFGSLVPKISYYIQDRDLWNFKLDKSHQVHAYVGTIPYDFDRWHTLEYDLEHDFDRVVAFGDILLKADTIAINSVCKHASLKEFEGHLVPVCNTPLLNSDVGHQLLILFPAAKFSITWYMGREGDIKVSFRANGDFDVSQLAQKFGGGGHHSASGCRFTKLPW